MDKNSTPQIHAMDLDNFEFDEVILRDAIVLNTSMNYFDHFENETK